jgi:2-amino-4-hydroxy-6-hydroxymethyldihydropteridine diphosphokinase
MVWLPPRLLSEFNQAGLIWKIMSHILYLSLGTNLGDRLSNLKSAITSLVPEVQPIVQSSVYETKPWGYTDQPIFLNQVLKTNTVLEPMDLLEFFKHIEVSMGRRETFRFGPRLIDLDILFYDELEMATPELTIPHPRIKERAFILVPLNEIAPDLIHPGLKMTIGQLITSMDTTSVKLFQPEMP